MSTSHTVCTILLSIGAIVQVWFAIYLRRKSNALKSFTGILTGKDAKRFHDQMEWNANHPLPKEEVERIRIKAKQIIDKSKL